MVESMVDVLKPVDYAANAIIGAIDDLDKPISSGIRTSERLFNRKNLTYANPLNWEDGDAILIPFAYSVGAANLTGDSSVAWAIGAACLTAAGLGTYRAIKNTREKFVYHRQRN